MQHSLHNMHEHSRAAKREHAQIKTSIPSVTPWIPSVANTGSCSPIRLQSFSQLLNVYNNIHITQCSLCLQSGNSCSESSGRTERRSDWSHKHISYVWVKTKSWKSTRRESVRWATLRRGLVGESVRWATLRRGLAGLKKLFSYLLPVAFVKHFILHHLFMNL